MIYVIFSFKNVIFHQRSTRVKKYENLQVSGFRWISEIYSNEAIRREMAYSFYYIRT